MKILLSIRFCNTLQYISDTKEEPNSHPIPTRTHLPLYSPCTLSCCSNQKGGASFQSSRKNEMTRPSECGWLVALGFGTRAVCCISLGVLALALRGAVRAEE